MNEDKPRGRVAVLYASCVAFILDFAGLAITGYGVLAIAANRVEVGVDVFSQSLMLRRIEVIIGGLLLLAVGAALHLFVARIHGQMRSAGR